MPGPLLKTSIIIGIAASLAIILFQVSNILLVYKYFRFDYYVTAIAVLFLIAGFFISRFKYINVIPVKPDNSPFTLLSAKELSILKLIAAGKSNKEIAALNFVEASTVKTHINNIYGKLNIKNRRQAMQLFGNQLLASGV